MITQDVTMPRRANICDTTISKPLPALIICKGERGVGATILGWDLSFFSHNQYCEAQNELALLNLSIYLVNSTIKKVLSIFPLHINYLFTQKDTTILSV